VARRCPHILTGSKQKCINSLVLVVLDVAAGLGSGTARSATSVLAYLSLRVGLGADEELLLRGIHVVSLAGPGLEGGLLESTTVGEGELPRARGHVSALDIHGVKVDGSLLFALASRKEVDGGYSRGHSPAESADSVESNLLRGSLSGAILTGAHHVGLQEGTFQQDVVPVEAPVYVGEHTLSLVSSTVDIVITVHEDLGLNDGHKAVLLADSGIAGERLGVLLERDLGGAASGGVDLEHGSPLGEAGTSLVVLSAPLTEAIEALGDGLTISTGEGYHSLIYLDTGDHALSLDHIDKSLAILALLVEGLLEKDDTRAVLAPACTKILVSRERWGKHSRRDEKEK